MYLYQKKLFVKNFCQFLIIKNFFVSEKIQQENNQMNAGELKMEKIFPFFYFRYYSLKKSYLLNIYPFHLLHLKHVGYSNVFVNEHVTKLDCREKDFPQFCMV